MPDLNHVYDRSSLESRTALVRLLINIFSVFEISDVDATILLGYSEKNNLLIKGFKAGKPLANRAGL